MNGLYEHTLQVIQVASNDLYWWIFGNHNGWLENLSYVANIVMALAAVFAGIYAVIQLSHSKKNSNISFVMDLIDRIHETHLALDEREGALNDTTDTAKAKPVDNKRIENHLINLLEAYSGFVKDKSVSGDAYKTLVALLDDDLHLLKDIPPFDKMLEDSKAHPTRFENIKWFLAGRPRKKYFGRF